MRLLLIRHAQSHANASGELSTAAPGPDLTDLGREQAEALAEALRQEPLDALYASTLARTHQTAAPLARERGLELGLLDGVHEIEAGDLEGTADEESLRAYLTPVLKWGAGDLGARVPGAFDGEHFLSRFDRSVAEVAARHGEASTVGIVSHAGSIRVWIGGRTTNLDPAFTSSHSLDNTGLIVVVGTPESGWRVESWMGEPIGGESLEDRRAPDPLGHVL
ncbi:Phosphoserine phosphatase 1 [Frondihabitans sp. 762G35]|uniref:histidine phosphatase family protein n=1 Tax=Frondihabitans sp. 762G35 TaxID=1446794 RepID=UPI000D208287|nr:histidine phosphatase family protein [Frondihabitans sp. 762G35]ARC57825.1 Phosphoserine phosphatase 1 [Frondihabitans sp. 762G35]